MTVQRRKAVVRRDIALAEPALGSDNVVWAPNYEWIMIKGFPLPTYYNRRSTNCLIPIPDGYGEGAGLGEFYVNPALRIDRDGRWQKIPHVFDDPGSSFNKYSKKGWRWLCIHPEWQAGDNILTFLKQIEFFLKDPWGY